MSPAGVHQTGFVVLLQEQAPVGGWWWVTSWAGEQGVLQNAQDTHACVSMWRKTHVCMVCVYNACLKEYKEGDAASFSVWAGNVPRAYRLCLESRYHSYKNIC